MRVYTKAQRGLPVECSYECRKGREGRGLHVAGLPQYFDSTSTRRFRLRHGSANFRRDLSRRHVTIIVVNLVRATFEPSPLRF